MPQSPPPSIPQRRALVIEDDPDIDGLETCRRLRRFTNAYVMVVSARNQEADLLAGLQEGADDYVTKPFSARELGARIDAVFGRPRMAEPPGPARDADVDDEQQRAAAVQRGLLPRSAPAVPGYALAGHCRPTVFHAVLDAGSGTT